MGNPKKLKDLIGILKDKVSLIKATLLTSHATSSIRVAVLRATTHDPRSGSPPEHRILAVLIAGDGTRGTACACIEALMDRLHTTRNASVALKCLFTIHSIVRRGSFILKDQLSFYPSYGGHNFLNLSLFRDSSDVDSLELSSWVRWYAGVVEQNLIVSRALGYYLSSSGSLKDQKREENVSMLLNLDLLAQTNALVAMVEEICRVPDSLHLQTTDLVYEVVRLVGEDYRLVQYEIYARVQHLGERMGGLNLEDADDFLSALERLENCRERTVELFANRQRNDALWKLISEARQKIAMMTESMREKRLVRIGMTDESSLLTPFQGESLGSLQLLRFNEDGQWLGVNRLSVTVPTVR